MEPWSLVFTLVLLGLALLPIGALSAPFRLTTLAWAVLWGANALLSYGFYVSVEVMLFVFASNIVYYIGGAVVALRHSGSRLRVSATSSRVDGESRKTLNGAPQRTTVLWLLFICGMVATEIGLRQLGYSSGVQAFFSGGQAQFFESLRLVKSSLTVGNENAVPPAITVATTALCAMSVLAGVDLRSDHARPAIRMAAAGATILLAFYISLATGTRSLLIVAILLLLSALIAAESFRNGVLAAMRNCP